MDSFGEYIKNGVYDGHFGNLNVISEKTLIRLKDYLQNKTFAIMSAYRVYRNDNITKTPTKEKYQRNRDLRAEFNRHKLGVYHLVGHWVECKNKDLSIKDCPSNMRIDTIERSYLIPNTTIPDNDFTNLIYKLGIAFNQDAVIIGYKDNSIKSKGIYIIDPDNETIIEQYSSIKWEWDKITKAYSEFFVGRKKAAEFIFEGIEIPNSNSGRMVMHCLGILHLV
jgi:hypothetical protein